MSFDYFYNREAEQYIHYTMPKMFFFNELLRSLSVNAKFLYAILLDRAKLSYMKGFVDEDGKVYIHFSQSEIEKLLNCGRTKVSEYFKELDEPKGVGLIERKQKRGIGKSDRIYVKNFAKPLDVTCCSSDDKAPFSRFAYFHDMENLRFENYQVPKTLFLDEHISKISNIAKMAYSIMLDRTKLSMSKGWQDNEGRIYIIFPQKELQKLLGCSLRTVNSALKELDIKNGVGLIDRTRQGMNSPDIIYILDYSTDLKYKPKTQTTADPDNHGAQNPNIESTEPEHREMQNLNTGSAKPEHREVQNLNIGSAKSEHREVQNLNIGSAKSEHIIYNNTDSIDTDFIDTNSINQSSASENANSNSERLIDGLTDRKQNTGNEMSFSEMLKAIDFHDNSVSLDFSNETDFYNYYGKDYYDWNIITKCCTIPYWLVKNKIELEKVLRFVFGYDCTIVCNDGSEDKETKTFIDLIIKSLLKMLKNESCILNKQTVKYYQIIDIINKIMHDSSLVAWLDYFKVYWGKALSEYRPYNPKAYFKTCIWNAMNDFPFTEKFEDNNIFWQAGYDADNYYSKNSACSKSSDYESDSKYSLFCNSYEPINDNKCEPCENHMQFDEIDEIPNEIMVSMFLVYALKNNKSLKYYLNKDYPYPLPDGLTLDSPFDLSDEKLKELETKYGVSLISLRVQENENNNDSNNCDLETPNENPLPPESIEPIEQLPEPRPEAAGTEIIPEAENLQYSDSSLVSILLGAAIENNKPLKCYLKDGDNYPYPLPDGLTLDSPFDLTDEKLKELETKYGVSLISLRVQENENNNDSNNYDLETLNETLLLSESIEPIEDNFIITCTLVFAIKANKSLKDYLKKDYPYPLPDGLTLDSPFDLSDEKLKELEVKYNVSLRVQENENNNDSPNDLTEEKLKELEEIYGVRLRK